MYRYTLYVFSLISFIVMGSSVALHAQRVTQWTSDGLGLFRMKKNALIIESAETGQTSQIVISEKDLGRADLLEAMDDFIWHEPSKQLLIFTHTARVWRYNTKGDYWVFNTANNTWKQLGKNRPSQTLMFAKFSPDGNQVA
ncbi:MAG: hypothetical protein RL131_830, partial [Bacteroidota bacterium]